MNNIKIKAFLDLTWSWRTDDNGSLVARISEGGSFKEVPVEEQFIVAAHPDLPNSIRALAHNIERPGRNNGYAPGGCVFQTYYMLVFGTVEVTSTDGEMLIFTELDDLSIPNDPNAPIRLFGTTSSVEHLVNAGKRLPCVVNHAWTDTLVSRAELDTKYPGWLERWNIGKNLGLIDRDLVQHTFAQLPQQSANIDDISFG